MLIIIANFNEDFIHILIKKIKLTPDQQNFLISHISVGSDLIQLLPDATKSPRLHKIYDIAIENFEKYTGPVTNYNIRDAILMGRLDIARVLQGKIKK